MESKTKMLKDNVSDSLESDVISAILSMDSVVLKWLTANLTFKPQFLIKIEII
jgi:hypothetical protein